MKTSKDWGFGSVVECLPTKRKALGSVPSPEKKKKKRKEKKKKRLQGQPQLHSKFQRLGLVMWLT